MKGNPAFILRLGHNFDMYVYCLPTSFTQDRDRDREKNKTNTSRGKEIEDEHK